MGEPNKIKVLPEGYQERLLKLVDRYRHSQGKRRISLRQLCRLMGDEKLVARISRWNSLTLSSTVDNDIFDYFAKVDPDQRSAAEIKWWVEGHDEDEYEEDDAPDIALQEQRQPSNVNTANAFRTMLFLNFDGKPVHAMVSQALKRHGRGLDDEGIDFFIGHTNAQHDSYKVLIKRYLNKEPVAHESMIDAYPAIATGINNLMERNFSITGDELMWLEGLEGLESKEPVMLKNS